MDAFSVSIANGLNEPAMKKSKMCLIAGTFALFQFLMPVIGWICVHTIVGVFGAFEKFVPYIALALLLYIGIKMIIGCIRRNKSIELCDECDKVCDESCGHYEEKHKDVSLKAGELILQGVATSIDALSVGFALAAYGTAMAIISSIIIAAVTFIICITGVAAGRKIGKYLKHAELIGGIILILIGLEIFIKGVM